MLELAKTLSLEEGSFKIVDLSQDESVASTVGGSKQYYLYGGSNNAGILEIADKMSCNDNILLVNSSDLQTVIASFVAANKCEGMDSNVVLDCINDSKLDYANISSGMLSKGLAWKKISESNEYVKGSIIEKGNWHNAYMEAEIIYKSMEMSGDKETVLLKLANDSYARMTKSEEEIVVVSPIENVEKNENVAFLNNLYKSFEGVPIIGWILNRCSFFKMVLLFISLQIVGTSLIPLTTTKAAGAAAVIGLPALASVGVSSVLSSIINRLRQYIPKPLQKLIPAGDFSFKSFLMLFAILIGLRVILRYFIFPLLIIVFDIGWIEQALDAPMKGICYINDAFWNVLGKEKYKCGEVTYKNYSTNEQKTRQTIMPSSGIFSTLKSFGEKLDDNIKYIFYPFDTLVEKVILPYTVCYLPEDSTLYKFYTNYSENFANFDANVCNSRGGSFEARFNKEIDKGKLDEKFQDYKVEQIAEGEQSAEGEQMKVTVTDENVKDLEEYAKLTDNLMKSITDSGPIFEKTSQEINAALAFVQSLNQGGGSVSDAGEAFKNTVAKVFNKNNAKNNCDLIHMQYSLVKFINSYTNLNSPEGLDRETIVPIQEKNDLIEYLKSKNIMSATNDINLSVLLKVMANVSQLGGTQQNQNIPITYTLEGGAVSDHEGYMLKVLSYLWTNKSNDKSILSESVTENFLNMLEDGTSDDVDSWGPDDVVPLSSTQKTELVNEWKRVNGHLQYMCPKTGKTCSLMEHYNNNKEKGSTFGRIVGLSKSLGSSDIKDRFDMKCWAKGSSAYASGPCMAQITNPNLWMTNKQEIFDNISPLTAFSIVKSLGFKGVESNGQMMVQDINAWWGQRSDSEKKFLVYTGWGGEDSKKADFEVNKMAASSISTPRSISEFKNYKFLEHVVAYINANPDIVNKSSTNVVNGNDSQTGIPIQKSMSYNQKLEDISSDFRFTFDNYSRRLYNDLDLLGRSFGIQSSAILTTPFYGGNDSPLTGGGVGLISAPLFSKKLKGIYHSYVRRLESYKKRLTPETNKKILALIEDIESKEKQIKQLLQHLRAYSLLVVNQDDREPEVISAEKVKSALSHFSNKYNKYRRRSIAAADIMNALNLAYVDNADGNILPTIN